MRAWKGILCTLALSAGAGAQSADTGKQQFQVRCAGCHGEDGAGGGHGPNIVSVRSNRGASHAAVREVIRSGLAESGMPAFPLPDAELDAIAAYFMTLKKPAGGDVAAGERFFLGKGKCSSCHMVHGRGGILGPDLSNLGRERNPAQIEQVLRDPAAAPGANRAVNIRLRDGQTIRGIAKNESAFDLQLLGVDGRLHLLTKDQIVAIVREKSLMPASEASVSEMRNLVAYLAGLAGDSNSKRVLESDGASGGISRPGDWPTYDGTYSGNRFSPLAQINTANVEHLAPKWMFPLRGAPGPLEVTPIVVDGVMYVSAVNEAYALDARSGREIWHYSRPRTPGLAGDAAGGINRGVAVLGDRIFMVTDHAHLVALHRLTGQLLWDVEMADYRQNYGATGAPLVVNDLIVAGVSGGDEGIRGFLDAYKASTGERAWRFWTVPARGEPGSETWEGRALEHGCGATWLTGTYDPEAKTLYWPTGNPCPDYNGDQRKGDNLYTSSVIALDPESGKLRWHYQFTPHDLHDWDATETPVLVDANFRGQPRKLMLQGNRNGFFYVLDRLTGKVLMAEPFVRNITWASGIGEDGRPKLLPGNEPTMEGQRVCPAVAGAANWASSAYHPATGLFYLFAEESCNVYSKNDRWWEAGKSFYGGGTHSSPGDGAGAKFLKAIDLQSGKTAWEIPEIGGGILGSGLMATAGGLLFYGDGNGAFVAADAGTGKLLWHFNTGERSKSGPMTYMVDGRQYIAMAVGSRIVAYGL